MPELPDPLQHHEARLDHDLRIEAYLDGELPDTDRRQLEARLETDPTFARELELARRIRTELRALPFESCPPSVLESLDNRLLASERDGRAAAWRRWPKAALELLRRPGLKPPQLKPLLQRPALSTLAALSLAALLTIGLLQQGDSLHDPPTHRSLSVPATGSDSLPLGPGVSPAPPTASDATANGGWSAAEVARAEHDVKLALAYLGRFGRTATESVRQLTPMEQMDGRRAGGGGGEP
ncbi:MAG: hypothetical protein MI919_42985 [Holophagales bacterium]|nr:hypothetical protein [Holophagales bacterium]